MNSPPISRRVVLTGPGSDRRPAVAGIAAWPGCRAARKRSAEAVCVPVLWRRHPSCRVVDQGGWLGPGTGPRVRVAGPGKGEGEFHSRAAASGRRLRWACQGRGGHPQRHPPQRRPGDSRRRQPGSSAGQRHRQRHGAAEPGAGVRTPDQWLSRVGLFDDVRVAHFLELARLSRAGRTLSCRSPSTACSTAKGAGRMRACSITCASNCAT